MVNRPRIPGSTRATAAPPAGARVDSILPGPPSGDEQHGRQLRGALELARAARPVAPVLDRADHRASRAARRASPFATALERLR
jgi:hypothetical protein